MNPQKQRALNWKEISLIILALPLAIGGGMAWSGDPADNTFVGKCIFFLTLPFALIIGTLYVSERLQSRRSDIFPDVLPKVRDRSDILQVGDAHFVYDSAHRGDYVEIRFTFQNLYDSPNRISLKLKPGFGEEYLAYSVPEWRDVIPAGEVIEISTSLPLTEFNRGVEFEIAASSKARRGRKVRFARREAMSFETHPLIKLFMMSYSHVHVPESATSFTVYPRTDSIPSSEITSAAPIWAVRPIWKPGVSDNKKRARLF